MAIPIQFQVVSAFTDRTFGGNPAAVVFLGSAPPDDVTVLQGIAQNFNQPVTSFLSALPRPPASDGADTKAHFRIRWFTPTHELPLCGHGTLAAAGALFATPGRLADGVDEIHFQSTVNGTLVARRRADGFLEIKMPQSIVRQVSPEEEAGHRRRVKKAFGQDDLVIHYVARGGPPLEHWLMVEIDENADLGNRQVDTDAFKGTDIHANVIMHASPSSEAQFVSRTFAPNAGLAEDPVCGSAHCMMTPYWTKKKGLWSSELKVRQVSPRGGELKVKWDEAAGVVSLQGQVKLLYQGELFV